MDNPAYDLIKDFQVFSGSLFDKPSVITRRDFCKKYTFAIPIPAVLEGIAKYSPIVEVGAGKAYWASVLRNMGVDIIATDRYPIQQNGYQKADHEFVENMEYLTANQAIKSYPDRNVFMCWPEYNRSWAYEALKLIKGQYLIYIGELKDGCCADKKFFNYLEKHFEEVETLPLMSWVGIHDVCIVYRRKA